MKGLNVNLLSQLTLSRDTFQGQVSGRHYCAWDRAKHFGNTITGKIFVDKSKNKGVALLVVFIVAGVV